MSIKKAFHTKFPPLRHKCFVHLPLRKSPQIPSIERVFATKLAGRAAGRRDIFRTEHEASPPGSHHATDRNERISLSVWSRLGLRRCLGEMGRAMALRAAW